MTMRKDAVFVNAVAKAEEKNLLSAEALIRLSAASFDEAIKMLHDYGYNEGVLTEGSFDIDVFIGRQINLLMSFIIEYSPSKEVEDFLLAPYLFNNIKAEYKRKRGAASSRLYQTGTSLGVFEGDYSNLDDDTKKALLRLDEGIPDSREIDRTLTQAMYDYKIQKAKKSKSALLVRYIKAEIDTVNLITSIRADKLRLGDKEREEFFIKGGSFEFGEEIPKQYEDFDFNDSVKLETQSDNYLLEVASSCSGDMSSIGPLISYVLRKMSELKTVKMILVCIKSNARSEIPGRLRGLL